MLKFKTPQVLRHSTKDISLNIEDFLDGHENDIPPDQSEIDSLLENFERFRLSSALLTKDTVQNDSTYYFG